MDNAPVAIKGTRDGLLVSVPEGPWESVQAALLEAVDRRAEFIRGARLLLDVGDRSVPAGELGQLRERLLERGVSLHAVLTNSRETRAAAADVGLLPEMASRPDHYPDDEEPPLDTELTGESAVLLRRTLRSGFSVRHAGHVVVVGDVNPGAEIIAGGNVIVWGRLRGVVHAGASGDEDAVVCALDLSPTQLRIAGHIAVSPEGRRRPQPEMARVRDGQLVAEPWQNERRR